MNLPVYELKINESLNDGLCHIEIKQSFGNYREFGKHTIKLQGNDFKFYVYNEYTDRNILKTNVKPSFLSIVPESPSVYNEGIFNKHFEKTSAPI